MYTVIFNRLHGIIQQLTVCKAVGLYSILLQSDFGEIARLVKTVDYRSELLYNSINLLF